MKKVRLLPRLLFLTLLAVVVASVMTAAIYSSVGPRTFANERVKELQLSAEVVSTYYVQYQSGKITLREFERALSMSGVITDSQMQVFNTEGKLIMRSTDDRPNSFVLKGQSDNILQLIRGGVQEVIEQGYPIIEEHVLNDEIGEICTVITPIYHSDDLIAWWQVSWTSSRFIFWPGISQSPSARCRMWRWRWRAVIFPCAPTKWRAGKSARWPPSSTF